MKISCYGHACYGIEVNGKNLLFDPFITPNEMAKDIDISKIPADYILISHGHEDHVADVIEIASRTHAKILSNFEIVSWLGVKGIHNGHPLNHGGSVALDFGKVKYVNAIHSSVLPDGAYGGNPGGFVIKTSEGNFYFAGDTALTMDMKLIPETVKLDFAILPIGDNFTMGIDDAVMAADFIKCNKIIGMHYDTFGYIEINHREAFDKFKIGGKELILMEIGKTIDI